MNDKPIAVARELLEVYGVTLLEDPERLGQLLEDKCGDCRHEIFILCFALRDILKFHGLPTCEEFEAERDKITTRFSEHLGFSSVSARWATTAVASILNADGAPLDPDKHFAASRGFLDLENVATTKIAKRPRTAPLRKKAFRNGFLLLGIIALFLGLFVRITDSRIAVADDYRVLFLAHLSGGDAGVGHVRLKGAQLAADRVNAQGGIRGLPLRIQVQDASRNPEMARKNVEELLRGRRISGIVSACDEPVNEALAALSDAREIPLIATESSLLSMTMASEERPWLYAFRINIDTDYKGRVMAYFLARAVKKKRAAILYDPSDLQSQEIKNAFIEAHESYGGEVVYEAVYEPRYGMDQSTAAGIISSGSDALVLTSDVGPPIARVLHVLRRTGYRETILGTSGTAPLAGGADPAYENSWWILPASPDDPQLRSFQAGYRDQYNESISREDFAGTVLAYDAIIWLADALYRAPGFQGEALRHALLSTRNVALLHATLSIDPRTHGPWNKAISLAHFVDGREKFQKRFRPQGLY